MSALDILLIQRNAGDTGFAERSIAPVAESLVGFDSSQIPTVVTIGSGLSLVGNELTATGGVPPGSITTSGLTMNTARLLGRTTASTGAIEELTVGTSLNLTAGALNTIQGIRTTDSPTFAAITATGNITGLNLSGTNTGDQTTVSGNAGTATILQTARAIYGNIFDGSAALAQIIASTYGGTGNGFTRFTGPTTSEKTFTLPNANAVLVGEDTSQILTNKSITWPQVLTGIQNNGSGFKHARVTTGSIPGGSTALVSVTWGGAFANANYTVTASIVDPTTTSLSLSVVHIESISASGVDVRVLNNAIGALTGTLHVTAVHD